jgi:hypothetical protein
MGDAPFAECSALCKEAVCRVPHSAKPALGKGRLYRVSNTRQRGTLGKCPLCRVSDTRQRVTLGKKKNSGDAVVLAVTLCRVSILALGKEVSHQSFFFIFVFNFFLWVL